MNLIDPYYKKTISYKHGSQKIQLKISQELFSSLDIDHGTQRLLRTLLFESIDSYSKVLDFGCGYGPIGITMKKVCPSAKIHMVDVDALALEFTNENIRLNGIDNVRVYASLGYDQVNSRDFDIIVSNIPAKIGEKAITHILKDAKYFLSQGGKVIVVVIDEIAKFVADQLEQDENIVITYQRSWSGHYVYHYQFQEIENENFFAQPLFDRGLFFSGQQNFQYQQNSYVFDVSHNLPEFDQLSFETELLIKSIKNISDSIDSAMCFQVGQGFVPFFVAKHFGLSEIKLAGRDLLALKTSRHNLQKYGIQSQIIHSIFPKNGSQSAFVVGKIPEKQSIEAYELLLSSVNNTLLSSGQAVLVSSSTVANRIDAIIKNNFEVLNREKAKGITTVVLKKQEVRKLKIKF
jgi:16S rRNA (guanine1207-N2)-methyltransferase